MVRNPDGTVDVLEMLDAARAAVAAEVERIDELVTKAAEEKTQTTTRELNAKIKALASEINVLKGQLDEYKKAATAKDKLIKQLETNLAERTVSSWL